MNIKNFLGTLSALVLVSFCGAAVAQMPASISLSQPSNSPGLAYGLISATGLSTAGIIGGIVGSSVGGFGGAQAGLDVKRYALSDKTGAAAAPGAKNWNVWGAFSRSSIAYNFTALQSSGSVNVFLAGLDYTFTNNVVFGVAAATDRTDVNLDFSGGKLTGDGVTVSPYIGVLINKNLAFDATLGYGRTNIETITGGVVGSTRTDRNVGSMGLTYRETIGAWTLSARGAYLQVHDRLGAYTLSNGTFVPDGTVDVSQGRLSGQVAYTSGPFAPYATVTYVNDLRRPTQAPVAGSSAVPANDRDAWTPAVGIRFRGDNSIYGSIQYSTERARAQVRNDQILFNVGIRY
jgi:hypothetical protein